MTDTTIPTQHYAMLAETAASHEGLVTARSIDRAGAYYHPGDPLGTILCEAWRLDPTRASLVMTAYMSGLRTESERRSMTPPALADVVQSLPLAINTARYPDVDVPALMKQLELEVPGLYGATI